MIYKNKGITLVALVITIVILIILATISINVIFGDNGLIQKAEEAKEMTANSTIAEQEELDKLLDKIDETTNEAQVNAPKLCENMKLVKYDEKTQEWVEDTTKSEYSYIAKTGSGDNNLSKWANAEVEIEGVKSYFVWIPRYAYKITYYTDERKTTVSEEKTQYGSIDVKFIKGNGNEAIDGTICKYVSENPNITEDYVIHPAFTNDVENGGWDSELTGIWVGKYESSSVEGNTNTNEDDVTTKKVKIQPGQECWRYITVGNAYTVAYNYARELESHMLKNSEWGAVAYLTYSQYGRNGVEITKNNNSKFITGEAGDTVASEESIVTNAYNTEKGVLASSTGNVYGIYDLSGGSCEYIASYYSEGDELRVEQGAPFTNDKISNKYATAYKGIDISNDYIIGDALYEIDGWDEIDITMINDMYPFFIRGGRGYGTEKKVGIFACDMANGYAQYSYTFRVALVV